MYASINEINLPQSLNCYLTQIGDITDDMGKRTKITIPPLPIARAERLGGYHATEINEETHSLFKEIPSLGIASDVVMALTSIKDEPTPNYFITIPQGTTITENLTSRSYPIGARRAEIRQRLSGLGITTTTFPEYIINTRFNWRNRSFAALADGKTLNATKPFEGWSKPLGNESSHNCNDRTYKELLLKQNGYVFVVEGLLDNEADINHQNSDNGTLLH